MKSSSPIIIQHFNCSSMGTRFDFLTYGLDEDFFSSTKTYIINELEKLEHKFSRYDETSEVSKINKLAAEKPVRTDKETLVLLGLCKEYYEKTNRLFDITVGLFTKHDNASDETENKSVPGADKIILNLDDATVSFLSPMLSIDLGGIGKGYAMEKIKQYCIDNRILNALISFGDSSITTLGTHPHGDYWPIGIQHAYTSGTPLHTFRLNDSSLSTSGNTPNNQIKFGTDGHILNPLTGEFQKESKTVSVLTSSPIEAEVLSTALFIAGNQDKAEILSRFNPVEAIGIAYNDNHEHKIINLIDEFIIIAKKE